MENAHTTISAAVVDVIDSPKYTYKRIDLSPTTVWRLRRAGSFPEPVHLSPGRIGYRRSDIDRWIAQRAQSR